MTQLKRILAGALSVCMVGSVMTACGNDDSSSASGGSNSTGTTNSNGGSTESRIDTSTLHGKESSEESKNTLTIYCWNTEFKSRVDKYYSKYSSLNVKTGTDKDGKEFVESINGVKLNWVQNENEGNVYQTKLDEALKGQKDSTEKVDMFLIELTTLSSILTATLLSRFRISELQRKILLSSTNTLRMLLPIQSQASLRVFPGRLHRVCSCITLR